MERKERRDAPARDGPAPLEPAPAVTTDGVAGLPADGPVTLASGAVLALQRSAGNRAVSGILARQAPAADAPAAAEPAAGETRLVLESEDPALDSRSAEEVATELREMLTSYRDGVSTFEGSALQMFEGEQQWAQKLNVFGQLVELVNQVEMPPPGRWDAVFALWDEVGVELDGALGMAAPETLTDGARLGQAALELFDQAFALGQSTSDEFLGYMEGFQGAAQTVHTVASVTRDIAFCVLLAGAVVVVAPAIAGAGLGTAATVGGTTLTMGLTGAALEGNVLAGAATVAEAIDMADELLRQGEDWDQAWADFDLALIEQEGLDGLQRGFIDGVLAYAGAGLDKLLAGKPAAAAQLRPAWSALVARLMHTMLTRATASGASGALIGALDAGAKAAVAGAKVDEIGTAMRDGFLIGAAAGAVLGGAGGAVSEALAARLRSEMDVLPGLLIDDPEEFARRYKELVESLTPEQRAAWDKELQGRRFVDKKFFDEAQAKVEAGTSTVPPEHRFGEEAFEDWQQAAQMLDEHARTGQPLTEQELRLAHEAAMDWKLSADPGELRTADVFAGGTVGFEKMWTALSPEQLAVLRRNPVINLLDVGMVDPALNLRQLADGWTTAIVAYPPEQQVGGLLDEFLTWYAASLGKMDPTELAATAQRRLVSIHPFLDGNGRVSRLVMDSALQSADLPPALLADPNLDFMVTKKAWIDEVRAGVMEAYQLTARHADLFNTAIQAYDLPLTASTWGLILGLTSQPDALVAWLYPDVAGPK